MRGYGQYVKEFTDDMEAFEATYGFSTWWVGGGYWSQRWQHLFDYFSGKLPTVARNVDYALEGGGITPQGINLLRGGFEAPEGADRKPGAVRLALAAELVKHMESWSGRIDERGEYILAMAKDVGGGLQGVITQMFNDMASLHNQAVLGIANGNERAIVGGVPLMKTLFHDPPEEVAEYPAYCMIDAPVLVTYANVLVATVRVEEDVRQTVLTGEPQGQVADYVERYGYVEPEKKSSAWKWILGTGLVAASLGTGIWYVSREKPRRGDQGYYKMPLGTHDTKEAATKDAAELREASTTSCRTKVVKSGDKWVVMVHENCRFD